MKLITAINSKGEIVDKEIFNEGLKYYAGKKVVLICDNFSEKRTIDQNAALWRWNDLLATEAGYTSKEIHYLMCGEIFGYQIINIYDKSTDNSILNKILLKQVDVPKKTTSNLTTAEWSEYISNYFIKAQELFNYTLPAFGWE